MAASSPTGPLSKGIRGCPGGSSLARLLSQQRGARNRANTPPLTVAQILHWADSHPCRNGGALARVPLDPDRIASPERAAELLALDEALTDLAAAEPRVARLVILRYFGGLTVDDAAGILGISPRTAAADWAYARAWLQARLEGGDAAG